MDTALIVGRTVRAELARAEWSMTHGAEVLGISPPAFRRRIRGQIPFDVAELETLSKALGVPYWSLAGGSNEKEEK